MPATAHRSNAADEPEVVKWYTRARRFPQLVGKTPSGENIWGGPYTYTQVAVGVGLIVVGSKTTWLWGHFGLIGNALVLFGATYGLVVMAGRLPIGSRNPLAVGAGVLRAVTSPAHGTLAGTQVRRLRMRRARSRLVITPDAPTLADLAPARSPSTAVSRPDAAATNPPPASPGPRPRTRRLAWPSSRPTPSPSPRGPRRRHVPTNTPVPPPAPIPSPVPAGEPRGPAVPPTAAVPVLTGVQRLLATTGGPQHQARKD